ncbi:hypothetical protein HO173_002944 [Letharia columbiana]|uniref:Uncharacterized protein n=1 Tax=Letharia columbiana TaxID=112416 RepID=A0A8H6L813_9LECA|nr:uncharacterized protein HO173_002944 [Letharia columbiana]KAF6239072.1 hypothetical protein HO173_002944 [Letharia columbiana]
MLADPSAMSDPLPPLPWMLLLCDGTAIRITALVPSTSPNHLSVLTLCCQFCQILLLLSLYVPVPTEYRDLTPELCLDGPTTTVMEYLTGPNPAVDLVDKVSTSIGHHMHCWWDIRNLVDWEDFSLDTIVAIPDFSYSEESSGLLNVPIPAAALPKPHGSQSIVQPSNERGLQDVITTFYAAKINAALKTCQGHQHYITMVPQRNREDGPFYVSAYANDETHALGRGRVVGLVKTYEVWNSSMSKEKNSKQTLYLAGLSHLHRLLRESNTRYGFIMTEIELVCVRMGTEEGKALLRLPRTRAARPPERADGPDGLPGAVVPPHAGRGRPVGGPARLPDRRRPAGSAARQQRSAVEAARAEAGARGTGRVDAARPGGREEVGEADPGLGLPRGTLLDQGETGDEGREVRRRFSGGRVPGSAGPGLGSDPVVDPPVYDSINLCLFVCLLACMHSDGVCMDAIPMGLEHSLGGVGAWMCPRSRIPCGVNLAGNAISFTYPFNLLPCISSLHAFYLRIEHLHRIGAFVGV